MPGIQRRVSEIGPDDGHHHHPLDDRLTGRTTFTSAVTGHPAHLRLCRRHSFHRRRVSSVQGQSDTGVPAHLSLMYPTGHAQWGDPAKGISGKLHALFDWWLAKDNNLDRKPPTWSSTTFPRTTARPSCLEKVIRPLQAKGRKNGIPRRLRRVRRKPWAFSSSALSDASRFVSEDPKCIERYGKPDPEWRADGAPKMTTNFLLARRLVEAGFRGSLNFSRWDCIAETSSGDAKTCPCLTMPFPRLSRTCMNAGSTGRSVVSGRIRRTPKINAKEEGIIGPRRTFASGRWRHAHGQVIGSTDKQRPNRTIDPSASRKSSPPSFTRWESSDA